MFLNSRCRFESSESLKKILMSRPHPRPIKLESLQVRLRHKLPWGFQWTVKVENHYSKCLCICNIKTYIHTQYVNCHVTDYSPKKINELELGLNYSCQRERKKSLTFLKQNKALRKERQPSLHYSCVDYLHWDSLTS